MPLGLGEEVLADRTRPQAVGLLVLRRRQRSAPGRLGSQSLVSSHQQPLHEVGPRHFR